MKPDITQILIRYDPASGPQNHLPAGEFVLAGVPLHARVIITALGDRRGDAHPPLVTVIGDYSAQYCHAVEAVLHQLSPDIQIVWQNSSAPWPDFAERPTSGRILLITACGLFGGDVMTGLADATRADAAFTSPNPEHGMMAKETGLANEGFWLLTPESYLKLTQGEKIIPARLTIGNSSFCPLTNEASVVVAEKWLFRRFGKSTDGFISKYLNRPLSTWVSRRLVRTSITPDHLTLLTAAFALLMFVVLKMGTPVSVALGCLLYHVTSIVDGFDGEVARAKFLSTRRGASFDTAVDMATNVLFILGLTLGLAKIYGNQYLILGGMVLVVAITAIALMAFVVWRGPKGGSFDVLQLAIRRRLAGLPMLAWLFEIINVILKRDFFALFFGLLGIFGLAAVIPWLLAAGMVAWLMAIIMAAPLVIGADPAEILPDHIGSVAVTKNPPLPGGPGE